MWDGFFWLRSPETSHDKITLFRRPILRARTPLVIFQYDSVLKTNMFF